VGKSPATAIVKTPVPVVFLTIPVPSAPKYCAAESIGSVVPWTIYLAENKSADEMDLDPEHADEVSKNRSGAGEVIRGRSQIFLGVT